jgi:hypothetical protein
MAKYFLSVILFVVFSNGLKAQDAQAQPVKEFMQITTIESIVSGGMGRSKMLITNPDGSQKEAEMNNLFSIAGINFKNIKENEDKVVRTLKEYTDSGWKLETVTPFALSQGENGFGIFMTRYLLSRPKKN